MVYALFNNGKYMGYSTAKFTSDNPEDIIKELTEQELLEYEEQKKEKQELIEFRQQREEECFSFVNRGQLWYNTLTDEQYAEFQKWYQDWLDVTETKIIPEKPTWLK